MFTGIITDIGTVTAVDDSGEKRFTLETRYGIKRLALGASISCDGCCLTVVEIGKNDFALQVSQETLRVTTLGDWVLGRKVNLERALKMGDELGGHMVSGHVDCVVTVDIIEMIGESKTMWFSLEPQDSDLMRLIAPKGSATLDGVSLTVNEVQQNRFSVNVIPHTLAHTTLGLKKPGDRFNLEIDLIARHIARLLPAHT